MEDEEEIEVGKAVGNDVGQTVGSNDESDVDQKLICRVGSRNCHHLAKLPFVIAKLMGKRFLTLLNSLTTSIG